MYIFMPQPALPWCYIRTFICQVGNQSLTNVTVYIQVYTQVYLHIYIHIYVQVAHNFDTFYATKLKFGMIFTQNLVWYLLRPRP